MGIFDAIEIAGSGLTAQRIRMDVTSENLANADTTRTATGQPYKRQDVVLASAASGSANCIPEKPVTKYPRRISPLISNRCNCRAISGQGSICSRR